MHFSFGIIGFIIWQLIARLLPCDLYHAAIKKPIKYLVPSPFDAEINEILKKTD
jgi:hypothetical protein